MMGTLEILDIVDAKGKALDKATCNTWQVYVLTDVELKGREILYE
jgi:hypothetical protein